MKKDNETKKVLSDGERVRATMETPGWDVIQKRFFEYLNALDSLQNITETDPEKVAKLILINQKVFKTLEMFWNDISGEAEVSSENSNALKDEESQDHIMYQE